MLVSSALRLKYLVSRLKILVSDLLGLKFFSLITVIRLKKITLHTRSGVIGENIRGQICSQTNVALTC